MKEWFSRRRTKWRKVNFSNGFLLFCWKIKCESSFTVKIPKQEEHISNDDGRRIRHMELSYSSNLSEVMIKLWYILKGFGCRLLCHVAGIGVNGISVNGFSQPFPPGLWSASSSPSSSSTTGCKRGKDRCCKESRMLLLGPLPWANQGTQ